MINDLGILFHPARWHDIYHLQKGLALYSWAVFLLLAGGQLLYERLVDMYWLYKCMK